jgi:hypothetical protein
MEIRKRCTVSRARSRPWVMLVWMFVLFGVTVGVKVRLSQQVVPTIVVRDKPFITRA